MEMMLGKSVSCLKRSQLIVVCDGLSVRREVRRSMPHSTILKGHRLLGSSYSHCELKPTHVSIICAAKNTDKDNKQTTPKTPPSKTSSNKYSKDSDGEEFEESFAIFDLSLYSTPFSPPWGAKETLLGMVGWAGSFIGVGLLFIPLAKGFAGTGGFSSLSQQDKAIFALVNQIAETAVGIAVINAVVSKFRPLPDTLLSIDFKDPFRKPDGWLSWGLFGVLLSPAVVYIASFLIESIGAENNTARGTADAVSQLLSLDPVTFGALFGTTAILAPLLEETVFRGFLLPSLSKAMPTPLAVLLSSIAFGLVHLSPRDTPQLTALGLLLGFTYVRSKNLLTPMLIHGVWNGTVLSVLYALQASGVDLQEVLHGGKF